MLEIHTQVDFERHLEADRELGNVVLCALDLSGYASRLRDLSLTGAVLLGCDLDPDLALRAVAEGALVFPAIPGVPYDTFRSGMYRVDELYDGFDPERPESYADTLDGRIYAHYRATGRARPTTPLEALARRLHDLSMTEALDTMCNAPDPRYPDRPRRRLVAVMGGHSLKRDRGDYLQVARISRELTRRGYTLVSGGGPGAMEATHLGAWFSTRHDGDLLEAVDHLATAPTYRDERWLSTAYEVRMRYPLDDADALASESVGIPTWLYGHEPPNPFATHIAKYFANSVREDGLVTLARNGIVFSPGSAGTIQEIFQDACQNHYEVTGEVSPMIFLGEAYWSWTKPVFPLLAQLAAGHEYASLLAVTDDADEVLRRLDAFANVLDARDRAAADE